MSTLVAGARDKRPLRLPALRFVAQPKCAYCRQKATVFKYLSAFGLRTDFGCFAFRPEASRSRATDAVEALPGVW